MYPIVTVPPDAFDLPEQLGTKRKFWYRDPTARMFLFKEGRPNTGENWAEKVCCEIAELLGIPHAQYNLATWRDHKGVISPKFLTDEARLVLGNEILGKIVKGYEHAQRYRVRQHTVNLAMGVMKWKHVGVPVGYVRQPPIATAADVFVSYLMLDALVSNQDRHHENWGLVVSPGPIVNMAPTFDHASSLGRNELDAVRLRRLSTKDRGDTVDAYVSRANSAFYPLKAPRPLSCLAAFQEAARFAPRAAVNYWLGRLEATTRENYEQILNAVPDSEITQPARDFALKMLEVNRVRLLAHQRQ